MKIASIDFETANHSRISMCAASVAVFEDGALVESRYWLVKPPKGHGWFIPDWTSGIHGISHLDVLHAPEFPQIAAAFLERLTSADIVIAHNARFDMEVLRQTLVHFQLPQPCFSHLCTCALARRIWPELTDHKLNTLAAHIGHEFNHHHAQSDAEAAGQVLLAMMKHAKAKTLHELLQKLGVEPNCF
jgi:DNA polymerase III subunit epsilon